MRVLRWHRLLDTSPWYGNGKSELRFGLFCASSPRDSFLLSTKIGRVYSRCTDPDHPSQQRWRGGLPFCPQFDYTREGVRRSYEQSLLRLGINSVDALLIHDIDEGHQKSAEGVEQRFRELSDGGGFEVLASLKASGEIKAIGAGVNRPGMIPKFLSRYPIDFFLLAMPYTLLSQDALAEELPLCISHGVSIIVGAPFASRNPRQWPVPGATYGYSTASENIRERVRKLMLVCERHAVPLGAAALQFPLGHPAVASVIPGPNAPDQVRTNLQWFNHEIPMPFWNELKDRGLIRAEAPVP